MANFPIALHPVQLRLIPVSEKYVALAQALASKYADIRIEIDDRAESVSKRIKLAHEDLVPEVLVIGEKEQKADWHDLENLAAEIRDKSRGVPFLPISWPAQVSRQVRRS
jgi:threonyl-tRNA synthetase